MKNRLVASFVLFGLSLGTSAVIGQTQTGGNVPKGDESKTVRSIAGDKWVITAEAGGVNHVEGGVSVIRTAGKSGLLLKGDTIRVGDQVTTDSDGRAEILLNPGSYARVAGNSEFEFKTTELEDLQLKLTRGSAIFEVFATNDFRVNVSTPKGSYDLIDSGVYRVDVMADGNSRLEVWKGKALAGDEKIKGGRSLVSGEEVAVKFDRDDKDEFELWSRSRAKDLAKSNSDLKNREMRTALMSSFLGGRWNAYDSFGLWVYNARFGRYCFLPFGWGWSSPYGYGFGADIWWYRLPSVIFIARPISTPIGPRTGGTGRQLPPDRQPIESTPGKRRERPPFADAQGGRSTGGGKFGGGAVERGGGFTPAMRSAGGAAPVGRPVYTSPRMSPPDLGGSTGGGSVPMRKGKPID